MPASATLAWFHWLKACVATADSRTSTLRTRYGGIDEGAAASSLLHSSRFPCASEHAVCRSLSHTRVDADTRWARCIFEVAHTCLHRYVLYLSQESLPTTLPNFSARGCHECLTHVAHIQGIGASGTAALAGALASNTTLTQLTLARNPLTDAGEHTTLQGPPEYRKTYDH